MGRFSPDWGSAQSATFRRDPIPDHHFAEPEKVADLGDCEGAGERNDLARSGRTWAVGLFLLELPVQVKYLSI